MVQVIQADENGALIVPAGPLRPGARYTVEPLGDVVILRRESPNAGDGAKPEQRIARLEEWIGSLPSAPALPREATRRDSMYD